MLGYEFEIIYKEGTHNVVEDALLRKEEKKEGSLCDISIPQLDRVEEEMIEWKKYQEVCNIIQQLHEDPSSLYNFVWKNDLIWYHDRLYLCKNFQLKQNVLIELHTSPVGGHLGFLKTYHKIKKDIFCEGIKIDVQKFVFECLVFQYNKGEIIKTPGLLQPLAIPSQFWE